MATGMFGANTAELRTIAGLFEGGAEDIETIRGVTAREVDGIVWVGNDADRFKDEYRDALTPQKTRIAIRLRTMARELRRNADEQDAASDEGRGGGGRSSGGRSFMDWLRGLTARDYWQGYKNLLNLFKGPRFLFELAELIRNPAARAAFFKSGLFSWKGITGFVPGILGRYRGLEAMTESRVYGKLYKFFRDGGDFLQAKWFSKPWLEPKLAGLIDKAFGRPGQLIFEAGKDGIQAITRSKTMDNILQFVGKEGRLFGKALGFVDVGLNGYDMVNHINNGNTGAAVYSGVKVALGAAAFIPGPVGWVAGGASLALAAYDNIPAVKNTVNAIGSGIAAGWNAINPFK